MSDTEPAIDALYRKRLLQLSPGERVRMASGMFEAVRAAIRSRLLAEQPDLSEADLQVRVFEQIYRDDFSEPERKQIIEALRNRAR